MGRCGGSQGTCACQIVAGQNVQIEGSGSALTPYVISTEQFHVAVDDTATVGLTLTGDGSETNPYLLTADFIGTLEPPDWKPAEYQAWSTATILLTDVDAPRTIRALLSANITTLTMPVWASTESGSITLVLEQDGTGGRTWVQPGTSEGGTDIVLSTAAGARDVIEAFWTGIQWVFTPIAMDVS